MSSPRYYPPQHRPPQNSGWLLPLVILGVAVTLFFFGLAGVAVWYFAFFRPARIAQQEQQQFQPPPPEVEEQRDRPVLGGQGTNKTKPSLTPPRPPVTARGGFKSSGSTSGGTTSDATTREGAVSGGAIGGSASLGGSSGRGLAELPPEIRNAQLLQIDSGTLQYDLQPNTDYGVSFWVDSTGSGGGNSTIKGRTVYRLSNEDPRAILEAHKGKLEINLEPDGVGTGTGFAIHPDGVIMTCAHVVAGAKEVVVMIDEQPVPAKVVAYDGANDLAVLKVGKTFSNIIPLSRDLPDLGVDCRVIGFPLADALGTKIKMSKGSVIGIDEALGDRRLMIDATVNPGNSGGPVVGEKGELLGVAAAITTIEKTQSVSFCVPVDTVQELLRKARIPFDTSHEGEGMVDSRSVRTFKDAIGCTFLIVVPSKSDEAGAGQLYALDFRITLEEKNSAAKSNNPITGKIVVDRSGKVYYTDPSPTLPLYIGRASTIGFDRYPDVGITGWQSTEVQLVNIDVPASSAPGGDDPFGGLLVNPRLRNPFGGPQMNIPQTQTVEAVCSRIHLYQTTQPSSKNYKKAMIVSCIDQQMDPKFVVACEGTISFDPKSGFAKKSMVKGEFESRLGRGPSRGRISIQYGYMNEQEIAAVEAEEKERIRKAQEEAIAAERQRRAELERQAAEARRKIEAEIKIRDGNLKSALDQFDPDK